MPSVSQPHTSDQPAVATACGASTQTAAPAAAREGKSYWRSIDDLADTPEFREFVHREFPNAAGDLLESTDRRQFLKIMSASLALAGAGGLAGCRRWPETKLAPYAHRPADRAPGHPVHYATSMDFAGVGAGLLVTSYDGRPIKIEGNPQHPVNQGATTLAMQAAILDMYDQDRSRHPINVGKESTWAEFSAWAKSHFDALANGRSGGTGLAFLAEASSSPSVQAMKQRVVARFPSATWHEFEAIHNDSVVQGATMAFGDGAYRLLYDFSAAKTVVSFDDDFLGAGTPASVKWTRDFAAGRACDNGAEPSRLYCVEGIVSLTGANADHRLAVRNSDVARLVAWLASQLGVSGVPASLATLDVRSLAAKADLEKVMQHLVQDLKGRGPSIVLVGDRQPPEVHLLGHLINRALGNFGRAITAAKIDGAQGHVAAIKSLAEKINSGAVQTLVLLGGNPVYNAPADLDFAGLIKKTPTCIHLSDYDDETSRACAAAGGSGWHVNRAHFLEAWGDVRAADGTWGITQPLIIPMFDGKTAAELLSLIANEPVTTSYEITRAVFAANVNSGVVGDAEGRWRQALHDGFVQGSGFAAGAAPEVVGSDPAQHFAALEQRLAASSGEFEVAFTPDAGIYDGRLANNGWLQELPDPIAKLTWDNAVMISAGRARSLGVKSGDMVTLTVGGKSVTAAAMIIPGTHNDVANLALGYGRGEACGRVGKDAGFDFYPLRTSSAMGFAPATIAKASGSYVLATTQDHHPIDSFPAGVGTQERLPTLFAEADLGHYREHPEFAKHHTHVVTRLSLFPEDHPFQTEMIGADGEFVGEYAWGMSIDLNACTGCNACVIACQAENNIAIVGKEQVKRGREMHWIRIDRYFKGSDETNPSGFVLQPVNCMQCENAPCEQVCPVAATTHDANGLNVMVYNRCIGTRYCSNNCPYKVRRFNYFDWWGRGPLREQPGVMLQVEPDYYLKGQAKADPMRQMAMNPEVTIRMRGIMEKCTYCVQRIMRARIDTKNQWVRDKNLKPDDPKVQDRKVRIPDQSFTTACAAACPARAIVFGDLNDRTSKIKAMHKHPRTYEMLEELNTKPRTRYMARIRNPAFSAEHSGEQGGHGAPAQTTTNTGGHG